ncbi:dicarboxylate/amino acid:cation symporter [Salana multivorans]
MPAVLKHPAVQIGAAAVLGIAFGLIVGEWALNLKFVGDIFIRLIQMAIVPLVMSSVIVATGSMSGAGTGKIAARTFAWMLGFSVVAAVIAWGLSNVIRPGGGLTLTGGEVDQELVDSAAPTSGWQDTLLNFVSTNVFNAMSSAAMIPIIVFSLIFGIALRNYVVATRKDMVFTFLEQVQQIVLLMIQIVMKIAPIGVFCLLAAATGDIGFAVVTSALKYLGTTALGVVIILALFVVVVTLRTGLNPLLLPGKLAEQTAIAVTTTSPPSPTPRCSRPRSSESGSRRRSRTSRSRSASRRAPTARSSTT